MANESLRVPHRVTNYQLNEGISSLHAPTDWVENKFGLWYREICQKICNLEMDFKRLDTRDLRNLHDKKDTHSAKLRELSRDLENVKLENEALRQFVTEKVGTGYENYRKHDSPPGPYAEKYDKEEEGNIHDRDFDEAPDGQRRRYWGYNYFITPEMATSKRWEDLQNVHHKIEDWKRRKQLEEEKWMKDKPKTYEYTGPYQEYNPPRDINKYFHDSKFAEGRPDPRPEEYYFNDDIPLKVNASQTTYEHTYNTPRRSTQPCGGLYILRYDDSGHEEVSVALKNMQTIIKSYEGYVMGMARKNSIFVIEGDGDWTFSKYDKKNPRIGYRHRLAENGLAVIWFPGVEKARGFFTNTFRNPFKETGFPTSHGFEAFYVPMISTPVFKTLDTYLLIEFSNAHKYKAEDLLGFEAEAREKIFDICPNSQPMVVSCLQGRESFKPGPFVKQNSKLFISRFNSQTDVAAVWNSGKLQEIKDKYNLSGLMNVVSFSLIDWRDYL